MFGSAAVANRAEMMSMPLCAPPAAAFSLSFQELKPVVRKEFPETWIWDSIHDTK